MPETIAHPAPPETVRRFDHAASAIERACLLIPPLWDLRSYVAVNPFLGFADTPIEHAMRTVRDGLDAEILPEVEHYRWRWRHGDFHSGDVARAAARAGAAMGDVLPILEGHASAEAPPKVPVLTFAEWHDRRMGSRWHEATVRSVCEWCATFAAGGTAAFPVQPGEGLYAFWRGVAAHDRSLEFAGLRGFRAGVRRLPATPREAITRALEDAMLAPSDRDAYLYRLLGGVFGWAAHFRRLAWERDRNAFGMVEDLLAIRVSMDAAVSSLAPRSRSMAAVPATKPHHHDWVRLILQDAAEDGFARRALRFAPPPRPGCATRPTLQAAFCIDVRSEVLRRHLETHAPDIRTHGAAGFFGVALELDEGDGASNRCPVLLRPGLRAQLLGGAAAGPGIQEAVASAPGSAFAFVELAGGAYALGIARGAAAIGRRHSRPEESLRLARRADGSDEATRRAALAEGFLRGIACDEVLARLFLVCGHAGCTSNNPHAAGLDCGACGGHGGATNARFLVQLLNDGEVRAALAGRGMHVPADTRFIAGVHDTSTDEVRLLDEEIVPRTHAPDLVRLRAALAAAGAGARAERASTLGISATGDRAILRALRRRAADWSEVRPEWGLARNAAFVAGRRERTRGVDLGGRAFLHDYDPAADPDGAMLEQIVAAPVVVASWINLQYLGSTVDNDRLGAGDKAMHNRVGSVGVLLGGGGDLRTGLPLQSVQDADGRWMHQPLRLQVVLEAPTDRIDAVLARRREVRDLVDNGWVRFLALDPDGTRLLRLVPGSGWQEIDHAPEAKDEDRKAKDLPARAAR